MQVVYNIIRYDAIATAYIKPKKLILLSAWSFFNTIDKNQLIFCVKLMHSYIASFENGIKLHVYQVW